jgi:hypothetical protein
MFCKTVIKETYMFRSLFYDHLQGSPSYLMHLLPSAFHTDNITELRRAP